MSKWTKRRPHTSLGFIKVDLEAKIEVDSRIFNPTIGLSAGIEIETEEIIIVETMIGPIVEIDPETIIDKTIGETTTGLMKDELLIDKTVEETATDKTIETGNIIEERTPDRDIEIGVRVGIDQGHVVVIEVDTEIKMDGCNKDPELCQMTGKDLGPGPIQE